MQRQFEEKFRGRGIDQAGTLLLRADTALEMVEALPAENIRLLGIDGFRVSEEGTQPLQDDSVDLSREERVDAWSKGRDFLKTRLNTDLYFEVVIE